MQPLISQVDHESRNNTHNTDQASEATPLLPRFPHREPHADHKTTVVVSLLAFLLFSGVIIGIYLMILQSNSENVLPPMDRPPLQLISRAQWDPQSGYAHAKLTMSRYIAHQVIIVQTDTRECDHRQSCVNLMQEIKVNGVNGFYDIQYNFLVAEDGETFEGLGWRQPSPLFADYATTGLVIAIIGNYTHVPPTRLQVQQSQNIIAESLSQQRLKPTYQVIGKSIKYYPKHLFLTFEHLPNWNNELTDKE